MGEKLDVKDLLAIIGAKEVEITLLRQKIALLEQQAKESKEPAVN